MFRFDHLFLVESIISACLIFHSQKIDMDSNSGGRNFCCLAVMLIVIGSVLLSLGALPKAKNLNGFHQAMGVVSPGSRWFYVSTSDDSYYEVVVHYFFLNGHSCRYVKDGLSSKNAAQAYIRHYGTEGQRRKVFYKPPNFDNCYLEEDVESNFNWGVSLLIIGISMIVILLIVVVRYIIDRKGRVREQPQTCDAVLNPLSAQNLESDSTTNTCQHSGFESDHASVSNPLIARREEQYCDEDL